MQLDLADPNFHKPGSIDVLLGAVVDAHILQGIHKYNSLIALNSRLGWLISDKALQTDTETQEHNMIVAQTKFEADQLLRQFWEIEENLPHKKPMTELEAQFEEYFKSTHARNDDGRYIVCLPFKDAPPTNIGVVRLLAVSYLQYMKEPFTGNADFKEDYHKFMKQYESESHMIMVSENEKKTQNLHYLPHYAVLRPTSLNTKLRVVFDGSATPERGKSLNEELLIGYPLQQDDSLALRKMLHAFAFFFPFTTRLANNPADLAFHGVYPSGLQHSELWWNGPQFLEDLDIVVNLNNVVPAPDLEMKVKTKVQTNINVFQNDAVISYLKRYSTLSELIRVTAYCLRFIKLCKLNTDRTSFDEPVYLSPNEFDDGLNRCIKIFNQFRSVMKFLDYHMVNEFTNPANYMFLTHI
ncbi:unnamed protein product [Parnassius mnemosyne]|uniref:Uncharacterized protein n=1 Tax=Parnassius mnemosyne TaxID=213953 RepID=A0AAV1LSW5_9NEOP